MERKEMIRVALADDHPVFRDSVRQLSRLSWNRRKAFRR